MKYYSTEYRDSFLVMKRVLNSNGWTQVLKSNEADAVFIDREPTGNERRWDAINDLATKKPVFIYPHTPYSSWLWDGYTKPSKNIACNFVCNEAALKIMDSYGYPCRRENIGFSRPLQVKPFSPTKGVILGYSGPRLIGANGKFYRSGDAEYIKKTMGWIIENKKQFLEVKIFYSFSLEVYGLEEYATCSGLEFVNVAKDSIETKNLNTETALRQLEDIDIFIGSNTLGYIALSQGIPTVLVGHNNDVPSHSTNNAIHYSDYAKWCDFPLKLEEMDGRDLQELCKKEPESVMEWKRLNIGTNFDSAKFFKIVKEYV